MKEHKVILNDLKKFLRRRGIETEITERFISIVGSFRSYVIFNTDIVIATGDIFHHDDIVASLSDPNYREKVYEHFKYTYDIKSDRERK